MSIHRYAAHRDAAEPAIISALEAVGASVQQLSGKDVPDLLVGYRSVNHLLEVKSELTSEGKDGYRRTRKTKVSKGQKAFAERWRGAPVHFVLTPEDALRAVGAIR